VDGSKYICKTSFVVKNYFALSGDLSVKENEIWYTLNAILKQGKITIKMSDKENGIGHKIHISQDDFNLYFKKA